MTDPPILVGEELKVIDFSKWNYQVGNGLFNKPEAINNFGTVFEVIAGIPGLPTIDFNGFESQFDIGDVNKLLREAIGGMKFAGGLHEEATAGIFFRRGFKACQSRNRFSEEDMQKALITLISEISCSDGTLLEKSPEEAFKWVDKYCESLSQPKIFDIEIEMETMYLNKRGWQPFPDEHTEVHEIKRIPKINNNTIKIIKRN